MSSDNLNFPLDASQYKLLYLVGRGATSDVYVAKCLANNQTLSIKLINLEAYPLEIEFLRQEVAFWSSTQLPQVVRYYGSFVSGPMLYILMEYMAGGSVSDIIRYSYPKGFRDENITATILYAILKALSYIHSHNELHRDVKPGNALIGQDGQVKIGDFGVAATLFENGQRKMARYTVIGTPCYMAPEILQEGTGYTQKADIWSFGITAIELATGQAPYSNLQPLAVVQKILRAPPPLLSPNSGEHSKELCQVIKACLIHDPTKRPTADDLLQMPFFTKVQNPEYLKEAIISKIPSLEERYASIHAKDAQYAINQNANGDNKNQGFQFDFGEEVNPQQQLIQIDVEPKENVDKDGKNTQWNFSSSEENTPLNNFSLNIIDFTTDNKNSNNKISTNNSNLNNNLITPNNNNFITPNSNNLNGNSNENTSNTKSIIQNPSPGKPSSYAPKPGSQGIQKGRFKVTKQPSKQFQDSSAQIQLNSSTDSGLGSSLNSSENLIHQAENPKPRLRPNTNYYKNHFPQSMSLPPNTNPISVNNNDLDNTNDFPNKLVNNHVNRNAPAKQNFKVDTGNRIVTKPNAQDADINNTNQIQKDNNNNIGNENLSEIVGKLQTKTEKLITETDSIKAEIQKLFALVQSLNKPKDA